MSAHKEWPSPAEIVAVYKVFGDEGVFAKWPGIDRTWLEGQLVRGLSDALQAWRGRS